MTILLNPKKYDWQTLDYYQYNLGGWNEWQSFPGDKLNANFPYKQMGYGDGMFTFNVKATDSSGNTGEFIATDQSIAVDLADEIRPAMYMPIIGGAQQ